MDNVKAVQLDPSKETSHSMYTGDHALLWRDPLEGGVSLAVQALPYPVGQGSADDLELVTCTSPDVVADMQADADLVYLPWYGPGRGRFGRRSRAGDDLGDSFDRAGVGVGCRPAVDAVGRSSTSAWMNRVASPARWANAWACSMATSEKSTPANCGREDLELLQQLVAPLSGWAPTRYLFCLGC